MKSGVMQVFFLFRGMIKGAGGCSAAPLLLHAVLHAVALFGALGIVESIERADEVAGNAANALEGLVAEIIGEINVIAVYMDIDAERFAAELFFGMGDISIDFFLFEYAAGNGDAAGHGGHLLSIIVYTGTKNMKQSIDDSFGRNPAFFRGNREDSDV